MHTSKTGINQYLIFIWKVLGGTGKSSPILSVDICGYAQSIFIWIGLYSSACLKSGQQRLHGSMNAGPWWPRPNHQTAFSLKEADRGMKYIGWGSEPRWFPHRTKEPNHTPFIDYIAAHLRQLKRNPHYGKFQTYSKVDQYNEPPPSTHHSSFNTYNGQSHIFHILIYFWSFWIILKQILDIKEFYLQIVPFF